MSDQTLGGLDVLRGKERVYEVELSIERLYPVQKVKRAQRVFLGKIYEDIKRGVRKHQAEESGRPDVTTETRRMVERWEEAEVFTWPLEKDGTVDLTDFLTGQWGAVHKAFAEYWNSLRKADYVREMLNAVRVEPNGQRIVVKPKFANGDNEADKPFSLPVPRSRGQTRQIEYYDYLEHHKGIKFHVRIPGELPLSYEEFLTLIHGLEMTPLHPLRRGVVKVLGLRGIQNPYKGTEARGPDTVVP